MELVSIGNPNILVPHNLRLLADRIEEGDVDPTFLSVVWTNKPIGQVGIINLGSWSTYTEIIGSLAYAGHMMYMESIEE